VRDAHKKITGTKRMVDPKLEQLRNDKLAKIDEDFTKGIRHGHRLGETPKEEFMSKPEFLRRDNKITTAPSQQVSQLSRNVTAEKSSPGGLAAPKPKANPRRLSYMVGITEQDENSLSKLYEEKAGGEEDVAPLQKKPPGVSMSFSPGQAGFAGIMPGDLKPLQPLPSTVSESKEDAVAEEEEEVEE
jgi:hypothetical protein